MLNSYYIEKLIGFQGVQVKNIEEKEEKQIFSIELERKEVKCPCCGKMTSKVHDYRTQIIKDLPEFGKTIDISYRKRRYVCECGKRFAEPNDFLARYQRMTNRAITELLDRLSNVHSYTSVGKEFGVSPNTVIRFFENVQYPKPTKLPEVIGIDEFKGNSGGEKFNGILTDIAQKRVIDILKTRKSGDLYTYFRNYDRSEVKYFVSDMYAPYRELAETFFPNATYVIDKYHWIRQATWAFENVRKEVQKKFSKKHRIYFKHSRSLLLKRMDKLGPEQVTQVMIMLDCSAELSTAYFLKEQLYKILDMADPVKQRAQFSDWIEEAEESEVKAFQKCAKTYRNWFEPITNSFFCPYTNGFTEGCNNKIKVLKRNAFGMQDFNRFRNRILFVFQKAT